MYLITGGAGFIGSNLVRCLNKSGIENIIIVDNLKNGKKFENLSNLNFVDFYDKNDFIENIDDLNYFPKIEKIIHLGACSSTTEWDGKYIMKNNFEYSKKLFHYCADAKISFIYASSASVYGLGLNGFKEERICEKPINVYAFSKFQFDQYVRSYFGKFENQVVGLRYFNVYGPGEKHKKDMSSPVYKFSRQIKKTGFCNLFKGYDGFKDGQQKRDFVFVDDCVQVKKWFLENEKITGIFNLGTGNAESFEAMADAVCEWYLINKKVDAKIKYIEFPDHLKGAYQSFTKADISNLRNSGYQNKFFSIKDGVFSYLDYLQENGEID